MTSFSKKKQTSNSPLFTVQTGFNQQNNDIFFISIWCEAISHQSKLLTPCVIDTPTKHSHNVWEWWHSPIKHAIRQWRDGGAPGKGGKWLLYSPDATYYLSERPCPGLLVFLFLSFSQDIAWENRHSQWIWLLRVLLLTISVSKVEKISLLTRTW